MPGNPREMITMAKGRFPHPHQDRHSAGRAPAAAHRNDRLARGELWGDGWATTPSGMRGVLNDAHSIVSTHLNALNFR
jgi:hypothetical protein